MDGVPLELGVYGIFALLVIEKVLSFLKWWQERQEAALHPPSLLNGDATVGSKTVDFWKAATHAVARQAVHEELVYPLGQIVEIRSDTSQIRSQQQKHAEVLQQIAGTQDLLVRLLDRRAGA